MKSIKLDLNRPFEETLSLVLALPDRNDGHAIDDDLLILALRSLYQTARGAEVQTSIGPVSIGPALDPSLREAPVRLGTRTDLLILAERTRSFGQEAGNHSPKKRISRSALFEFMAGRLGSPEHWPCPDDRASNLRQSASPQPFSAEKK